MPQVWPVSFIFLLLQLLQLFTLQSEGGRIHVDHLVRLRAKRDLTFPGTKWCGPGSTAANYSDLGEEAEVDKCCREHDHCPESMAGYQKRRGLYNSSPYTRSLCSCDETLRRCLEDVNSQVGNLVAEIFFNFLKVKCFKVDCPIVKCLKYIGSRPQRTCQKYRLDCTKKKIWQFFDQPRFEV